MSALLFQQRAALEISNLKKVMEAIITGTALEYIECFKRGHSWPLLFRCICSDGEERDVVVKCPSLIHAGRTAFAVELYSTLLAKDLGIPCPDPVLVDLDGSLAGGVDERDIENHIRSNGGVNFGCSYLGSQSIAWGAGFPLSGDLREQAERIFVFDAMIGQLDRSESKPNLLLQSGEFVVFDHEMAFPVIRGDFGYDPWKPNEITYLRNHLFFDGLRGREIEFDWIRDRLDRVGQDRLLEYRDSIPREWRIQEVDLARLDRYILTVKDRFDEISDNLTQLLR